MCLSIVYLNKKEKNNVVMEEASSISYDSGVLTVQTLFGERKTFPGYSVGEVNLLEHYVILHQTGAQNG
jgi:predicted RNA-binding protein